MSETNFFDRFDAGQAAVAPAPPEDDDEAGNFFDKFDATPVKERPGILKSLGAGIQSGIVSPAGGLVAGIGEAVGSEGLERTGREMIGGAKRGVEERMAGAQDWREIKSGGDLWAYVKENFGLNSPQMAAIIGSGLAAQAVIPPVALPGLLAKIGAFGVGAGAAALTAFTGSNVARQVEEGQEPAIGKAAAYAVPQAAAELMVARALGLVGADKVFTAAAGPFVKRLATRVGQAMAVGVPSEVVQQALERGAADLPFGDAKAWDEYLDSAVGAAAFLGPAGAVSAIPRGRGAPGAPEVELGTEGETPVPHGTVDPAAGGANLDFSAAGEPVAPAEGMIPPTPSEGGAASRLEADAAEREARPEEVEAAAYTPGYDVESLSFGVYGPEGVFVKTGIETEEEAVAAARAMGRGERPGPPTGPAAVDLMPDGLPETAEPVAEERPAALPIDPDDVQPREGAETAYTDMMIPLVERELGVSLTPEQRHAAGVLVRNGMDSNEAVHRIAQQNDIPFQKPIDGEPGRAAPVNAYLEGEPVSQYTEKEAEAVARVQAITERMFPGARTQIFKRLFGTRDPGADKAEVYGATYKTAAQRVMALSLASPDIEGTALHEGIHALRQIGAFTEQEWATLERAAEAWAAKHKIDERYPTDDPTARLEEAIAEEFSASRRNRFKGLPESVRKIFLKLDEYLRRIAAAARQIFGRDATVEDIFTAVERGEIGRRAPGERGDQRVRFQTPTPDQPAVAPQGRDPLDATSEAIAETIGQNQGTYNRALDRMIAQFDDRFKNLNPVEALTIFPHTLAKMDTWSARLWNRWKDQDASTARLLNTFRDTIPTFLDLNEAARDRIYGALELDRIFNRRRPSGDGPIEVHNKGVDYARKTKPGEKYTISDPKEIKAFHEVVALGDQQWDAITAATAKRMGWDGAPTASAVAAAARNTSVKSEARQLGRLAELLTMMAAQKRRTYMPLMRFGDFFIAVRPKAGSQPDSLGGFPELQWFETIERAAGDDIMGKSHKPGEMPKGAAERIAELKKQFPGSEIETGDLHRRPELLRSLDIPAVEKLLMLMEAGVKRDLAKQAIRRREDMATPDDKAGAALKREAKAEAKDDFDRLYDDLIDTFRDVMYQEMKAGFKKRAKVTPGYSGDFDRAVGAHMHQIAAHAASMEHRDAIQEAYNQIQDRHPHKRVRDFWQRWKQYQETPEDALGRAANTAGQVGYTWTLAMNPSSTAVNVFDIPQSAIPNLSIGLGMRRAVGHMSRALGQVYRHAKFDTKQGAHIDLDGLLKTLPPDEARFLQALRDEGATQSIGVDDMRALGERQTEAWGKMRSTMRYAMDIAISNMAVMDQANRTSTALAFYRAAKNPQAMKRMADAWSDNQVFRDLVERNGLSAETMGRFGLSEAAYEWGRKNRSRVMRGPLGTLMFTLHGYQTRFLSNAFKLMKNMGPEGRVAMAWMAAGLWAGAGIEGLPFAQDLMNLGDVVWKALTGGQKGHDPMIANRVRQMIHDTGFGKIGSEIVMRGPISTLTGTDLAGRLGFGDVITRQWKGMTDGTGLLGTVPSIIASRVAAATNRYQSGQGLDAAAAELLPAALRNPARAAIVADDGLKTQKGKMVIPASKISGTDLAKMSAGLRPLDQQRAYAHREYNYRAPRAHGSVPRNVIPKPGD